MNIDFSNYYDCINPCYHPFLEDYSKRYNIFLGGRGSGKSIFIGQRIIYDMLRKKCKWLICRKTFTSIMRSVIPMLRDLISTYKLDGLFNFKKSDGSFSSLNGSEAICLGLDSPERLKSTYGCDYGFIEELSELTEEEFLQVDAVLRGKSEHQIFGALNPTTPSHWVREKFFKNNNDNCNTLITTYKDNLWLDNNYGKMLESLRLTNEAMYRRWAKGEWAETEGIIFTNYSFEDFIIQPDCYGMDFGFKDPSTLVAVQKKNGKLYIEEIIYKSDITIEDLIELFKKLNISKVKPIYCDDSRPDTIESIHRKGYNAKPAKKKKILDGILWLQDNEMVINKNSCNLKKELENYCWETDKNGKLIDDLPTGGMDHSIDALRYTMIHYIKPELTTLPRHILGV